jgi:hypothetical protein
MKFEEAEKKLTELAKGEYHHLSYERTHYSATGSGGVKQECVLYISNVARANKSTWERAFQSLEAQINGTPDPTLEFVDEGPEAELPQEG